MVEIRGFSIESLISDIAALGRFNKENPYQVNEDKLIAGMMRRFKAERWEVEKLIREAMAVNVVKRENGFIVLVVE